MLDTARYMRNTHIAQSIVYDLSIKLLSRKTYLCRIENNVSYSGFRLKIKKEMQYNIPSTTSYPFFEYFNNF